MSNLLTAAFAWHDAGACVIPARRDGTKAPDVFWREYQDHRPTPEVLHGWFVDGKNDGFGIVCGAVSGGIEMFEAEARAVADGLVDELAKLMADNGLEQLWATIDNGYREVTPSGGFHWYYRVDGTPRRNLKLARRPGPGGRGVEVLFETRGEGGYSVVAPSAGLTHPTRAPWIAITGTPATIPTISEDDRDALHAITSMLDRMPAQQSDHFEDTNKRNNVPGSATALRPGDDYNTRADWSDILTGWTRIRPMGRGWAWRRPGKDRGISATTGQTLDDDGVDRLYVFSSSTEFEPERPYTKFGAYALLEHHGDHPAAAGKLRSAGYGGHEDPIRHLVLAPPPAASAENPKPDTHDPAPPTEGATALKVDQVDSDLPAVVGVTLTDQGNAELLLSRHKDQFRYAPSRGSWLRWDGARWAWCEDDGEVITAAVDTVHAIQPSNDTERRHKTKSLSRRSIEAMAGLARRDDRVRIRADRFDARPWDLNAPNGTIDLRTGQLRPHNPADLHTKIVTPPYDLTAPAPRWQAFLDETFAHDTEMIAFVQRLAGYSACGAVLHHVLPFLHGAGGNGKSVFLEAIVAVLGDYASTAPSNFLMASAREDDNAVARLAGLRLVVCTEVNQAAHFDEGKIKLLTGGDRLTARFLYQRHFTFVPSHTLWLMGNHQPRVDAGGESFWRRLRLIPFSHTVPTEQRIDGLAEQLVAAEGTGILAWVVAGALDALRNGLREPAEVITATAVYAAEEDALARFLDERCHLGGGDQVRTNTADMRTAYAKWCNAEGIREITPQMFGRELRSRFGIEQARSNGKRFYVGITLLTDPEDPEETLWWKRDEN